MNFAAVWTQVTTVKLLFRSRCHAFRLLFHVFGLFIYICDDVQISNKWYVYCVCVCARLLSVRMHTFIRKFTLVLCARACVCVCAALIREYICYFANIIIIPFYAYFRIQYELKTSHPNHLNYWVYILSEITALFCGLSPFGFWNIIIRRSAKRKSLISPKCNYFNYFDV